MRFIRVAVNAATMQRAYLLHDHWLAALREAREMMQADFLDDMWYEMRLYRDIYGIEGLLQGAYWCAFNRACPALREVRGERLLYVAYRPDCEAASDVQDLLALADLPVAAYDLTVLFDSHAGQPFNRGCRIGVRKITVDDDQLELLVWP